MCTTRSIWSRGTGAGSARRASPATLPLSHRPVAGAVARDVPDHCLGADGIGNDPGHDAGRHALPGGPAALLGPDLQERRYRCSGGTSAAPGRLCGCRLRHPALAPAGTGSGVHDPLVAQHDRAPTAGLPPHPRAVGRLVHRRGLPRRLHSGGCPLRHACRKWLHDRRGARQRYTHRPTPRGAHRQRHLLHHRGLWRVWGRPVGRTLPSARR
jgi:hypothetical protein